MTDRIDAIHAQLESGVAELVASDNWQNWLTFASKFHHYSAQNQLLILIQCPHATHVTGYRTWQGLGRQVRKGEKSIGILAPNIRKMRNEITGEEEKRVIGFRAASIFDISQTDGDPIPTRVNAELLEGESPAGLQIALEQFIADNGYRFQRGDCGTANGVTIPSEKMIRVREGISDAQLAKTTLHEISHMILHCEDDNIIGGMHRGVMEVEAESVAFCAANYFGIPTAPYSLPYIAEWASGDVSLIVATMNRVTKTSRRVIEYLEANM